jgi:lycopene cyclase domain-containing protein
LYTYLLINIFSILFPLLFSFHPKIKFYKEWKFVFPALLITAAFFLIWDYFFTKWSVWSFNPAYLTGIYIAGMPVEEWMFFIFSPYSCIFIYHCLNIFFDKDGFEKLSSIINWGLVLMLIIAMIYFFNKMYTFTTAFFLSLCLLWLMIKKVKIMGNFYRAYLVSQIPFLIINGILTSLPVVIYNNNENLGARIYTIPVEDFFYSMLMLLMNISLMEFLKQKQNVPEPV